MKNRFYNWVARQLTVEWGRGQIMKSLSIRVLFRNTVIATAEIDEYSSKWRFEFISKTGSMEDVKES